MNAPDRFELFLLAEGEKKVTVERDEKIHNAIIVTVLKEDHTFGNLLRMHLLRHPTVLFAGYKMPHPLEHKVVLSVRTTHDNPVSIVQEALGELYNMCDHLTENFREQVAKMRTQESYMD